MGPHPPTVRTRPYVRTERREGRWVGHPNEIEKSDDSYFVFYSYQTRNTSLLHPFIFVVTLIMASIKDLSSNAAHVSKEISTISFITLGLAAGFVLTLCRDAVDSLAYSFPPFHGLLNITKQSNVANTLANQKKSCSIDVVEICVSDIVSITEAIKGGATSLELCNDRPQGGITPSLGLIEEAIRLTKHSQTKVHVLIRPRPGGFVYTHSEFELMVKDVLIAKATGAHGVVVGVLTSEGRIDIPRLRILRAISQGMMLTFHRAFDMCNDEALEALQILIDSGCDRLLTSGRSPSAFEGRKLLQKMQCTLLKMATSDRSISSSHDLSGSSHMPTGTDDAHKESLGFFENLFTYFVRKDGSPTIDEENGSISGSICAQAGDAVNAAKQLPLMIVAAGGIASNEALTDLIQLTGVRAVHAGSSVTLQRQGGVPSTAPAVHMGIAHTADENAFSCVCDSKVRDLLILSQAAWAQKDKETFQDEVTNILCERALTEALSETTKEEAIPLQASDVASQEDLSKEEKSPVIFSDDDCYEEAAKSV